MTPKEKAKQLYDEHKTLFKHYDANPKLNTGLHEYFKKCALITVNEIIKSEKLDYLFTQKQINSIESTSDDRWIHETFIDYWNEVKREIQKL